MTRERSLISDLTMRIAPRSIIGWFVVCWGAFVLASVVVGGLLLSLYRQSTTAQLLHGQAAIARGCDAIAAQYRPLSVNPLEEAVTPDYQRKLAAAVQTALHDLDGVEGGIWRIDRGSLAYAFPTYEGTGAKIDVPQAEAMAIQEAAETAARNRRDFDRREEGRTQTLLLRACPLPDPTAQLSGWAMTRVVTVGGRAYMQAMTGLTLLMLVILGSAALLGRVLMGWSRRLQRLETALAASADEVPTLEATGQRDLDRIVDAVNRAGARLSEARAKADALGREVTEAKRLASLGRIVAGVAHEIRNPIAAMRLKAENAVAAGPDVGRKDRALQAIVEQIERLEALLQNLLSSVQRASAQSIQVANLAVFLEERAELFHEQAEAQGVTLSVSSYGGQVAFDERRVARALDNLILNAIQNTPEGGRVTLRGERSNDRLVLSVADTGRGVPSIMRDHLFEPFVTGRPEGTGLGLAIVREIAEAHGGRAYATHRSDGTTFFMELPWRPF